MKLRIIILLLTMLSCGRSEAKSDKVLIINSYRSDYQWSSSIVDALAETVKASYPGIELNVEFLSSELFPESDNWVLRMESIVGNYCDTPPLAIVLISDEAWMAYRGIDNKLFKDVPLLLCAVKPHSIMLDDYIEHRGELSLSNFSSTIEDMKSYNASGVLREMNIDGYLSLMCDLVPDINSFALLTDNRFYGEYTRLLFEKRVEEIYPQYSVDYMSAASINTDSLLRRLPDVSTTTGLLLTSWLTGEHGFEYSKDFTYKNMESILCTPIFITNDIGIDKGYFLGGYFNDSEFWGVACGEMLVDIIGGKKVDDIAPLMYKDEQCQIDWGVLHRYNLMADNLPDNVVFCNMPESVFDKHRNILLFLLFVFGVIIVTYVYTLRSHMKLKRAQKLMRLSINQTKEVNDQLLLTRNSLTEALAKAEESDRLKSAFIANMSHEIRTPLNAIVGFSEVLLTAESETERAEFSAIIRRNSALLLQLISDILDTSKLESGMFAFSFGNVDVDSICEDVLAANRLRCNPDVELRFNPPSGGLVLYTDPNRLLQILSNLFVNATKFTSKGSIEMGYFACDDDLVEFYVQDTGIGIDSEHINVVFDRFVKLNSYVEGTGLGLVICRSIVTLLGGEIGVESTEGEGSRFWFRIKRSMK